jgi:hypothetical protein
LGATGQERSGDFQGSILAAILDHDHFRGIILPFQEMKYLLQCPGQAAFFIVGWDDNG